MNKIAPISVLVFVSMFFGIVAAQENVTSTLEPTPTPPPAPNYFGSALAVGGLVVILAVIFYGGYKMIRKWTRSSSS
jgi:hypothetical protein